MARRASSSAHPVWILIAAVLLLGAVVGGYLLYSKGSDPYRTLTSLPVQDYLANSNSLRGNAYKIDATIVESLRYSATAGRLFCIEVNGTDRLPILVPAEFNHINIERGQRFFFKVAVEDKGVLRAQDVKKA
ncbi:MAG: hypothetical protein QOE70_368 [Chthoniobacter sp.]|jgi:hypothetical protein|nr:hypothetical protein [Chthoniobacter sp.]